jgi:hypothetical protein
MAIANLQTRSAEGTDPGAVDNRLSLDPNDRRWKKMLAKWEDGGRYHVTIGGISLEMDQLSPGEFEIVGGEAEEEVEGDDEEAAPAKPKSYGGKMNKAVRGMMDEE